MICQSDARNVGEEIQPSVVSGNKEQENVLNRAPRKDLYQGQCRGRPR